MFKNYTWYLPDYYEGVEETDEIGKTFDAENSNVSFAILDVINQAFPESATWGLAKWEQDLGIITILSKPIGERRSVVISKRRGYGNVSASLLQSVAESYENGSIAVVVYPNQFTVDIIFNDTLGTPPNVNDLMFALSEIIPSHLLLRYRYRYLRIGEIDNVLTLGQMESLKIDNFTPGEET